MPMFSFDRHKYAPIIYIGNYSPTEFWYVQYGVWNLALPLSDILAPT